MVAHLKIFLLIAIISIAVYYNSLHNSFHFDDQHYVVGNPYIRDISNIPTFFKSSQYSSFENAFTGHYRPLLVTSYAVNYAIGGLNPVGYHLVNLLFHVGSAFMVFLIMVALLGSSEQVAGQVAGSSKQLAGSPATCYLLPATYSALIFAVHPFNSEVVNYITARSSVMCSFFYLLSFYCWVIYRQVAGSSEQVAGQVAGSSEQVAGNKEVVGGSPATCYLLPATYFYFASLLTFILAMLTKEIAVTLPVMLFLYDLYFNRSSSTKPATCYLGYPPIGGCATSRYLAYLPYMLVVILPYLIFRSHFLGKMAGSGTLGFYTNLLTQSKVLLKYLQLTFLPAGLTLEHDMAISSTIFDVPVILSIISLFLIITAAYLLFKIGGQWRILSFFILWFFITLLPTTLIPLNAILQENRGYLAGIGFPLFAGICIGKLGQRASISLLLILISLYSILTIQRNTVWKDDYTLWTDAVAKSPSSARGHDNLGLTYVEKREYELAIAEFEKTLEINPRYYLAYYNAGVVYQLQNRLDTAGSSYKECIKINPGYFRAWYNIGIIYKKTGDLDKAIEAYDKAISLDPRHPFVYNNLGVALMGKGELNRAMSVFNKAIEIDPIYEKAYFNLGNIYYRGGKYDLAVDAYRSALKIKPDYREAKEMLVASLNEIKN